MQQTSLSVGILIRKMLTDSERVRAITDRVYPLIVDQATLPYVVYRRAALETQATKTPSSADTALVEVVCYASTYADSVALAEAVRAALDHQQAQEGDLRVRSCILTDAEELYDSDAYGNLLTFAVRA
jgi:hypothetical protein|nr:MAG TPA: hypothetical protein [Caudoviricetes sp.]DAT23207.1 MAG TPA: hypothetical protein [Caudoviricetes sp.]